MSDDDAVPLRDVTVRGYDDIDDAPMLNGDEKQALVEVIESTDFDSLFLLPDFKLDEDDHDVVRIDDDELVDIEHPAGRLAVGYWEDYSAKATRVAQYHRKNDPSLNLANPGCYIPKTTTVVITVDDGIDSIDDPQVGLGAFGGDA